MKIPAIPLVLAIILIVIGFLGFAVILSVNSVMAASGAEPVSTVEVDIYGPPPSIIEIQVPDSIDLGNISYNGDGARTRVDINNSGNVDVDIRPMLAVEGDEIFSNLYFVRRTTDVYTKIGDWSIRVNASTSGVEEDYFYMKLDLRDYSGSIEGDMLNERENIKFIATQA